MTRDVISLESTEITCSSFLVGDKTRISDPIATIVYTPERTTHRAIGGEGEGSMALLSQTPIGMTPLNARWF